MILVGALAPALQAVSSFAQRRALTDAVDGTAQLVDGLAPGLTAHWSFSGAGGVRLSFSGYNVTGTAGTAFASDRCSWPLPNLNPVPGAEYTLTLLGGKVEVSRVV